MLKQKVTTKEKKALGLSTFEWFVIVLASSSQHFECERLYFGVDVHFVMRLVPRKHLPFESLAAKLVSNRRWRSRPHTPNVCSYERPEEMH